MGFLSIKFLIFFLVVIIITYKCHTKYRNLWLLVCSNIFYLIACPQYWFLLILLSSLTYLLGLLVSSYKNKIIYTICLFCILLPLTFFKYFPQFISSINKLILIADRVSLINYDIDLLMPLGISFITFQSISYISDIYYKKICVEKNYINVSLFVCYFPNMACGPIQKARNMLSEIKKPNDFNYNQAVQGLFLFSFGALQKFYISDKLFPVVDSMLKNIENYSGFQYMFFAVLYAVYIYSNFNSYSDMAIGVSNILGIKLSPNFKRPYLSTSVKEFWRRWHISLNSWFIEYVYIPLGGSRKGKVRYFINIIVVFMLSGLWHGASFHYIIWGLLNAVYLIIGNFTCDARNIIYNKININAKSGLILWLKRVIVFYLISISWLFFAIPNNSVTLNAIKLILFNSIFSFSDIKSILISSNICNASAANICINIIAFFTIQVLREKYAIVDLIRSRSSVEKNFIYVLIAFFVLLGFFGSFSGYGNGGFVYGNF